MASALEEQLVTSMAARATRENQLRALLDNIERPGARRMLVQRCIHWMEQHAHCNELARELADLADDERGAA